MNLVHVKVVPLMSHPLRKDKRTTHFAYMVWHFPTNDLANRMVYYALPRLAVNAIGSAVLTHTKTCGKRSYIREVMLIKVDYHPTMDMVKVEVTLDIGGGDVEAESSLEGFGEEGGILAGWGASIPRGGFFRVNGGRSTQGSAFYQSRRQVPEVSRPSLPDERD